MKIKGIDVSQWQGNIDFGKVKAAGYKFVILRCNNWDNNINGVVKDSYFEANYKKAKAAGLDVGVYYFTWQTDSSGARYDAELCKKFIAGKTFEYPVYFDLEWQKAFARGKNVCSDMVKTFCGELEKAGYFAGLYISRSPLQNYITAEVAERYALWVAEYGSRCNYSGSYGMWQYTSTGKVSGVNGACDCDYAYTDYPSIIKNGGFNGYTKPQTTEKTATVSPEQKIGDLNGDGKVNVADVSKLAAHVKGEKPIK